MITTIQTKEIDGEVDKAQKAITEFVTCRCPDANPHVIICALRQAAAKWELVGRLMEDGVIDDGE